MTRLLRMILAHRLVVLLLTAVIIISGAVTYYLSPKQEYPDIAPPMALLTTVYPGALPEEVERLVTRVIEEEVETLPGYLRSNSRSFRGVSVVVLELTYGSDTEDVWDKLRNQLSDLQNDLPEEAHAIQINTKLDETAGFILALTGEGLSSDEMLNWSETIRNDLRSVTGVSRVDIHGDREEHVRVHVDVDALNSLPLALTQISEMIRSQAATIPLGEVVPDRENSIRVNLSQYVHGLESLDQMVLMTSGESGTTLRLGQIASIDRVAVPDQQQIWHNGVPAVLLAGYFEEGQNVLVVGDEIQNVVREINQLYGETVSLEPVLFQPDDIASKVNTFVMNLVQGIFFVILIVFLGMGIRNSLVVSCAIPLSILITVSLMWVFEIPVHQISIAALIIALGMLVDNAIVVTDAIQVRMDGGEDRLAACLNGTRDVTVPVFTSTLTTIGAFIPLLMLDSLAGEFVKSIPQIVMIALASSYIVSVFFVPSAALLMFKPQQQKGRTLRARQSFYRLVDSGIMNSGLSLMILTFMALAAVWMGFQLGLQFFPKADTDIAYIDVRTEKDVGIDHTTRSAMEIARMLADFPEITQVNVSVGDGFPKFYHTLPVPIQARNYAQIMFRADVKRSDDYRHMSQLVEDLQLKLQYRIPGTKVEVKLLEQADPIAAPILARISGGTREERQEAAEKIRGWLEKLPGTVNVKIDEDPAVYEYQIEMDDEMALRLGISRYQLVQELNVGLTGHRAATVSMDGKDTDIFIDSTLASKTDLESFGISTVGSSSKIPLRQIAIIGAAAQPTAIRKNDGRETITVQSDVMTGYNVVNLQNQLQQLIEADPPDHVRITYAGEREEIIKYFGEVGVSAIFAVMIVFLILVLQFGGLRLPMLILLTIPFSAIGSIAGLWLFRQPMSFTALLGIVSLFGIVVNNAIILLDYIQYEVRRGSDNRNACRKAVALRLRPILLTTATTVMGLMPLILSGSDLFTPMATALTAGLILSTFLTLVILPVLYLKTGPTDQVTAASVNQQPEN